MKYILALIVVGFSISGYANSDTLSLEKKIIDIYEYVDEINEKNFLAGKADENIYVIDPDNFRWNEDIKTWVYSFEKFKNNPILVGVNQRLAAFNATRQGTDPNTGKDKDGFAIYAVIAPQAYEAYLRPKLLEFPPMHAQVNAKPTQVDEELLEYFTKEDAEKLVAYRGDFSKIVARVRRAIKTRHPAVALFSYTSMTYIKPDTRESQLYVFTALSVDTRPTEIIGPDGQKQIVPSPLAPVADKIVNKANVQSLKKSYKTEKACVDGAIEKVIVAIRSVMDNFGNETGTMANSNCKPYDKWPLKSDDYTALLEKFKNMTGAVGGGSDKVLADRPELFQKADASVFPDKVFITEKMPELLGNMVSGYSMQVQFANTNYDIPDEDRKKLAEDVFHHSNLSDQTILLIVPYYFCNRSKVWDELNMTVMMPAVYSTNGDLMRLMNEAFHAQKNFTAAFNMAFEHIPKEHTAYIGAFLWNGQFYFDKKVQKDAVGFSNLVDVYALIDNRLDLIQSYLNCRDIINNLNNLPDDKAVKPDIVDGTYAPYLKCLKENQEKVIQIITSTELKYNEINPGKFNIRQTELLSEEGATLAYTYTRAIVIKSMPKFSLAGEAGNFVNEDNFMDDSHFYGKVNPVHEDSWGRKAVEVGSFLANLLGPAGALFDVAAATIFYVTGDYDAAEQYGKSAIMGIVIPKALEGIIGGAFKNYKLVRQINREGIVNAVSGGGFYIRSEGKILEASILDKGFFPAPAAMTGGDEAVLVTAGVSRETVQSMPAPVKKKIKDALVDVDGNVVKAKPDETLHGMGSYGLRNDCNDRNLVRRFGQALESRPTLTFLQFREELRATRGIFNFSESASATGLRADVEYCDIIVDGIKNGKITVAGREMTAQEVAAYMKANQWKGKPVRVISIAENNEIKELSEFTNDLGKELDAPARSHRNAVRINEGGQIVQVAGERVEWGLSADYTSINSFKDKTEMLRTVAQSAYEKPMRRFTIIPEVINPDGSVVCRINGQLTTVTSKELADEIVKAGLRGDESIFIGVQNGGFIDRNYENINKLAYDLEQETGNTVIFAKEKTTFINKRDLQFKDRTARDIPWGETIYKETSYHGEKKITLLSEKNLKINEADGNIYVTIEGFTKDGKVKVTRPGQQAEEMTAEQFYKEIDKIQKNAVSSEGRGIENKTVRVIAADGAEVDTKVARGFLEEFSQTAKTKIETPKTAINVPDGSAVPVSEVSWLTHHPMDEGLYYLQKNLDTKTFTKILDDYEEEFADLLGKALRENNGKYMPEFKKPENLQKWLDDLASHYTKYGKVSIPTYSNINSVATRIGRDLEDALVKEMYNNPAYAKKLDEQIKWLEASDIEKLKKDPDLFNEAIQWVESETMVNGKSLPGFMAVKQLDGKLSKELIASIAQKYGDNELFLIYLSNQIDKNLTADAIKDFELYGKNFPDLLENFKAQYLARATNPGDPVDLLVYLQRFQEKSQMNFAGDAIGKLRDARKGLIPQAEYFDVFIKTDGKNFIIDGQVVTPQEVARRIRSNPDWANQNIRFVVEGDNPKPLAQQVLDELNTDGKINPTNDLAIADGKLKSPWQPVGDAIYDGVKDGVENVPLYTSWDEGSGTALVHLGSEKADAIDRNFVGSARLHDGWIEDPILYVKKDLSTDGERVASGKEVWKKIYEKILEKNGGQQPLGIKSMLVDNNFQTYEDAMNRYLADPSKAEVGLQELMRDAVAETHGGKMSAQCGFEGIQGKLYPGTRSIKVTFVKPGPQSVHNVSPAERSIEIFERRGSQKAVDAYHDFFTGVHENPKQKMFNNLSEEEEAYYLYFASDGNHALNDAINTSTRTQASLDRATLVQIDAANEILRSMPKHRGTIYRGAGGFESRANSNLLDAGAKELTFEQFLYTTKDRDQALKYLTAGGDDGFIIYEIEPLSAVDLTNLGGSHASWQELVSPTKTKYSVVSQKEELINGKSIMTVKLKEM